MAHVAVVGTGVAGLAAAARLRAGGHRVTLLEAGPRPGGRALTTRPESLGGHPFDHGAQWLHAAERNPLLPVLRAAGEAVVADDAQGASRVRRPGGSDPGEGAYAAAAERWRAAVSARLAGPDISLAAAGPADDPWTATVEAWEATIIAAADADAFSLRDWHENALEGTNAVPAAQEGLGTVLARVLHPAAGTVHAGTPVHGIAAAGQGVRIATGAGTLAADAAIVTVSTGVLRAGAIAFAPALPAAWHDALHALPMGTLLKIAVPATGANRLGMAPGDDLVPQLATRGGRFIATLFWPRGAPYVMAFVGGRHAEDMARWPLSDAVAAVREELASLLGSAARSALGESGEMTRWSEDPLFRGAYAYAVPGGAGARAALAQPLWEGRLIFAGEALAGQGMAGTVGGAYANGCSAAGHVR